MLDQLWEVEIVLMFQNLGAWLDPIMLGASSFGYPLSYLTMVVIYWCVDSRLGRRFSLFLLFTGACGALLQLAIGSPRPYWIDSRIRLIGGKSSSFGMPSGHALSSLTWLLIAQSFKRWWVWFLMGTIVVMIGLSRVYLGVHFASQVVVGWMLSFVLLVMLYKFEEPISQWFQSKSFIMQLLYATVGLAAFLTMGWLASRSYVGHTLPSEWVDNAGRFLDSNDTFAPGIFERILTDAGAFFGCFYGILLIANHGGYDASGSVWARIGRLVFGIILASIILGGVFYIDGLLGLSDMEGGFGQFWLFTSNFLITIVFYYLIPFTFQRFRLAPRPSNFQSALVSSSSSAA
ncbi:MAG: phosphatase PAP2 family protein [Chloroflexota bacterium]